MTPHSRRKALHWWGVVFCAASVGCGVSPTLPPLPPPEPGVSQISAELVLLEGTLPVQRGFVVVLNTNTNLLGGQLVEDFDYSFQMAAESGDQLQLWYRTGTELSDFVTFEIE